MSGGKNSDFFVMKRGSDADISATVSELCLRRLPAAYGEDIVKNIQVLSPSKKRPAGTEEICRVLSAHRSGLPLDTPVRRAGRR